MDPRQKQMASLVGILSLVLGAVLFVSLGGVKGPQTAANNAQGGQVAENQTAAKAAQDWKSPTPLPQNLRNAAYPAATHSNAQQDGSTKGTGELVVKGILYSKNKPSAIINDMILADGESYDGIKLVKITKETVEFEANGKRWTQFVQR